MGLFDKMKEKVSQKVSGAQQALASAADSTKKAFRFTRLKEGLAKTRNSFVNRLSTLLRPGRKIDESLIGEIEEILFTSDIGVKTTTKIIDAVRARVRKEKLEDSGALYGLIKDEIVNILGASKNTASSGTSLGTGAEKAPHVVMVVGVNGVGKTTSIGKLARNYREAGKQVLIGAADTFRAAANEQLEVWAERAEVEIIMQRQGADPAAVAFDTLKSAQSKGAEIVIIDTAGRLHNKIGLMSELEKIGRVMKKLKPTAPDEVFLVLDATTGQNAIQQAREFMKATPITGLILTKLDGTAKGGVIIAIADEFNIPVRYIGVGEQIHDLQEFDPVSFAEALFQTETVDEADVVDDHS